jgi:hypothetical protein
MSAAILLHRDPIPTGWAHVDELPAWIPPVRGTYWHQPRSAAIRDDGILVVHAWCGQSFYREPSAVIAVTPPLELKCGTCIGRRQGYAREDGAIFSPRDHWQLPRQCPGGPDDNDNCFACGYRLRWYRSWFSAGPTPHRPNPELAERFDPCPYHGWTQMREAPGHALACGVWRCDFVAALTI